MVILFIIIISGLLIFAGNRIFKRWINPISIYVVPWGVMLLLYEVNFLRYYDLTGETWFVVSAALFSFLAGIMLIKILYNPKTDGERTSFLNYEKTFKYLVIIFSLIGLFDALLHWSVLFRMYGSLPGILIHANEIYRLRIEQKIPGLIPYLVAFSYAAVFFAGVYSACRGRITLISILPVIGVTLKEIANVGRAGIMLAFLVYLLAYFFTRNILKHEVKKVKIKRRYQVLGLIVVIFILISAASFIRSIRGTYENFAGASKMLSKTRGGVLITPSIYLYFSAHVGVLNQFLKDQNVNKDFGENTFLTAYSILSKFELVERPSDYQEGYRVPFWTNTGTYLREVIEDFGFSAIFLFPFFLGLCSTYFWFRFLARRDLISLILLTYICSIIGISFLMMITRSGIWTISFTIVLITAFVIKQFSSGQRITSPVNIDHD